MHSCNTDRPAVEIDKYIGARIRAARRMAGLSQAELGAALGVSFQQAQKVERGANRISAGNLVVAARALKVEVSALLPPEGKTARDMAGDSKVLEAINLMPELALVADIPPLSRAALRNIILVLAHGAKAQTDA